MQDIGSVKILTTSKLPSDILNKFLQGEYDLSHKHGIWNGNWSDMIIILKSDSHPPKRILLSASMIALQK